MEHLSLLEAPINDCPTLVSFFWWRERRGWGCEGCGVVFWDWR